MSGRSAGHGRRRRGGGGGGGGGGHDTSGSGRWMVSYMDMVTVIMCLFIVLFAISSVDQDKYQELKSSLAAGFGTIEDADVVEAVIDNPATEPPADVETDLERALAEVADLTALRDAMAKDLESYGMSETVRFEIDERGLTVRLVSADTFFSPGSADLTEEAGGVLQIVGPVLAPTPYEIQVEGNADYKSTVGSRFPTNWELSSSRATAVLRYLVEHSGLTEHRIAAVGFGSARPLAAGTHPEALAANRRVDIMVLSAQPEAVRALIPEVLGGTLTAADVPAAESAQRAALAGVAEATAETG
ncbi:MULTISPECIES: OmpA/MotB family protein [Oerskovia]|uniref:Flagellar motor protein MotB n=1 Tax=Oerskovia rustica TaxID=2762237 RepID=A0ABR8RUB5_9CELL|nr:flagellar motor protein MotB [Oerskovia rustica]MBD7951386.1 flagellar motor protein MotB [Oerskovia rustica]